MAFEHSITTRFFEVDKAGILFFGHVFEYCHEAYEELMASMFGSGDTAFGGRGWGTPLVHAEADFRRPIRMGERLTIQLELERLGERSITYRYTLVGSEGDVRATAKLVHAVFDMTTYSARSVPPELADALRRAGLVSE